MRAVAKHSPELAQSVVDCGALDALVICLEEFDPGVKEAAAWALGYIARHNAGKYITTKYIVYTMLHFVTLLVPLAEKMQNCTKKCSHCAKLMRKLCKIA